MAHFARLDENGIVLAVHVVDNVNCLDTNGNESEDVGIAYLATVHGEGHIWKQTSYNGNFRKNYAGVGYSYDSQRDAFIAPKPFQSWVLDENTCQWISPIPYPQDGGAYVWDESAGDWVAL